MSDQIFIRELLLRTIIGVNEEERNVRQDVLIDVTLDVDTRAAGESDAVTDTVSYSALADGITALVEGSRFGLIEKLAAEIAALCLEYPLVEAAQVEVQKPDALRFARSAGVRIVRTRAGERERSLRA
jgi:FolB domain-containing protein